MEGADPKFIVFLYIMLAGGALSAVYYPLWGILHKVLPRRLDAQLFRKPFFNDVELINYQAFPFSLVKTLNYSYLIAIPSMAKRKRFKKLDKRVKVNPAIRIACIIHIWSALLGTVIFFAMFGYGGGLYFFCT